MAFGFVKLITVVKNALNRPAVFFKGLGGKFAALGASIREKIHVPRFYLRVKGFVEGFRSIP
jgi:hypothetical protein